MADVFKPKLKPLRQLNSLRIVKPTYLQAKADGEFAVCIYEKGDVYALNRWGTVRRGLPCLQQLQKTLTRLETLKSAILLGELYVYDGKPRRLPDFIRAVHSQPEKVSLGLFALAKVNGKSVVNDWCWQMGELEEWLGGWDNRLHVLPYAEISSPKEAEAFWSKWVSQVGYEGVVARNRLGGFKIKPEQTLDAVVIGVNKRPALRQGRVTSLALALMDRDGALIHIGDVSSGIDPETGGKLYALTSHFKVAENRETIYVEPILIVEVRFYDIYPGQRPAWKWVRGRYLAQPLRSLCTLKSPVLLRFREDKKLCYEDLSTEQIPL